MVVNFTKHEAEVILFALKADLETVENSIEDFIGEDETLMTIIHKIEEQL